MNYRLLALLAVFADLGSMSLLRPPTAVQAIRNISTACSCLSRKSNASKAGHGFAKMGARNQIFRIEKENSVLLLHAECQDLQALSPQSLRIWCLQLRLRCTAHARTGPLPELLLKRNWLRSKPAWSTQGLPSLILFLVSGRPGGMYKIRDR